MRIVYPIVGIALTLTASLAMAESEAEKAAVKVATEWLHLVDEGRYADSWSGCAEMFKARVTQASWSSMAGDVRKPLGAVRSRTVKSAHFAESLPGAPDGKYVVIQFNTVFEHKKAAVETVTPMLESDGHWRVSGYYVK